MTCPDSHRLNRRERWCYGVSKSLHHASGEEICVTCGRRRVYDRTFNADHFPVIKYAERVDGEWKQVKYEDLVWEE